MAELAMLADIHQTVYPEEVTRLLHVMAQARESSPVIDRRSNHCTTPPMSSSTCVIQLCKHCFTASFVRKDTIYIFLHVSRNVDINCVCSECGFVRCVLCAGDVTLTPFNSALCYVNGKMISDETLLKTGSRVIFGRSHVFRFTNPQQGMSLAARLSLALVICCHLT